MPAVERFSHIQQESHGSTQPRKLTPEFRQSAVRCGWTDYNNVINSISNRKIRDIGQFINGCVPHYASLTGELYVPLDSARRHTTREKRLCDSCSEFIGAGNQHRKTRVVV